MQAGEKYLITTDGWFIGPDGETYKAVFGTVHALVESEAALGIRTNRNSTNWYVAIGDMILAGCQVHYAVRADSFSPTPPSAEVDHEGQRHESRCAVTRIYDADASGLRAFAGLQSI